MSAALAKMVAEANPQDVEALSAMPMNGTSVDEARKALIGKVGENLSLRRFKRVEAVGVLTSYIHGGAKVATLVDTTGGDALLAKDIAMHIAATKPKALDSSGVPAEDIAKERSVAAAKAAESGKPAEIVAKMVDGSIAKFLKEVSLLSQPFVKELRRKSLTSRLKWPSRQRRPRRDKMTAPRRRLLRRSITRRKFRWCRCALRRCQRVMNEFCHNRLR
jgi:elongation factor Ts